MQANLGMSYSSPNEFTANPRVEILSNPKDDDELWSDLVEGIKKYTNLKQGEDYWLGLRWSWNSYGTR